MDWATFFKEYQGIITVVSTLLGIVLTYFLTKRHYERNRNWQLEDRAFTRRSKFIDGRIEELESYLSTYIDMTRILVEFEVRIILDKEVGGNVADIDRIPELLDSTRKGILTLTTLNDSELNEANHELVTRFTKEYSNSGDLQEMIENNESLDTDAILTRVLEFQYDTVALITIMQRRLDELAQTIP
jgi:hypothetical protein